MDAPTAKFLVDHAIRTLLKRRTCILVSHAVQLVLPFADYVVSIKNGDILAQGHPHDISKNPRAEGIFGLEIKTEEEPAPFDHDLSVHGPLILPQSAGTKLVNDEERATGSVRLDVYRTYFKAAGGIFFALVFFLSFFVGSTIQFGNDWWLKTWTDSNAHAAAVVPQMYNMSLPTINMKLFYGGSNGLETKTQLPSLSFYQIPQENETVTYPDDSRILSPPHPDSTFFYISIYGLFGVAIITASNLQTLVILFGSLIASRRLHNSLLGSILGAPLRFFEVTPIGRVLNRFSKDVENVDK